MSTLGRPRAERVRLALISAAAVLAIAVPSVLAASATGINIQLPNGYTIAGTVKTTGAVAIPNASVFASGTVGAAFASTSATGACLLMGLPAGTYKIAVYMPSTLNLVDGWYTTAYANHFTAAAASATGVVVGPSKTGINLAVPAGFTITGKITTTTGVALAGASVGASGPSSDFTSTAADGTYKLKGLAAGSYTLFLSASSSLGYLGGVYTTANTNHFTIAFASATKVAVGPSKTAVNAKIPTGYSISGTLTNTTGTPLSGVAVFASSSAYSGYGFTDATGKYKVPGLAFGTYKLSLSPGNSPYVEGWYTTANTNHFTTVAATATGVAVGPSKVGINAKLALGLTISGKVTTTGGVAIANESVGTVSGPSQRSAVTDALGNYKLVGLKAGTYTIGVEPDYGLNYQTGFYTSANTNHFTAVKASATGLVIGPSKTGVNIKDPAGYSISGTIKGPGAVALAYAGVSASNANGAFVSSTALNGTYKIIGLSPGTYKVNASPPYNSGLVGGWYTTANVNHYTAAAASATGVTVGP